MPSPPTSRTTSVGKSQSAEERSGRGLPDFVRAMLDASFYPHHPVEVELIQTHISYVFLAGDRVYKVKKAVRFSFLDFSTIERRRFYCHEEVRLNRRLAADVYLGVVAICETGGEFSLASQDTGCDGPFMKMKLRVRSSKFQVSREDPPAPASPGAADVVDYAVVMRRLPEEQMLSAILARGEAGDRHIEAIAERLVEFHRGAAAGPEITANGDPARIREAMDADFAESYRYRGRTISQDDDRAIQRFCRDYLATRESLFRRRQAEGRIRDCHGDLRAEHVCFAGGLTVIDCIEFEPRFRQRDVAAEVAFLAMDIEDLGHKELARRLVRRYSELADDPDLPSLVPFYGCHLAYIRGKVDSLKSLEAEVGEAERSAAESSARRHFALAHRLTWTYSPMVIAVCGLSGTGKTSVAEALVARTGFAHLSSDIFRKKLTGYSTNQPAPVAARASLYSEEMGRRTYAAMMAATARHLRAGEGVVLDATFQRQAHREPVYEVARAGGVSVLFAECRCPEPEIRRRLEARVRSAEGPSDADWDVYLAQRGAWEDPPAATGDEWLVVDSSAAPASVARRIEARAVELAGGLLGRARD